MLCSFICGDDFTIHDAHAIVSFHSNIKQSLLDTNSYSQYKNRKNRIEKVELQTKILIKSVIHPHVISDVQYMTFFSSTQTNEY